MTKTANNYFRKLALLLAALAAALVLASGAALAVSKVCPSGTTQANPCSGTTNNDLLVGTSGPDYIVGLAGNDKISGGTGDDTTNGGGGSDTYSDTDGWGVDTLTDSGGSADHLNFSAVASASGRLFVVLRPEFGNTNNAVFDFGGVNRITLSGSTVIEKVTGSSGDDNIGTGGANNTLRPGPGTGGAVLTDFGGFSSPNGSAPASSDTYTGFSASGYGSVSIEDWGGAADKLVLPFASTDAYFQASSGDSDPAAENLRIFTSATDVVFIRGQLEPDGAQKGHIEQIQFTDETITIGSETPTQSLSGAKTTGSVEAQVAALNEASHLDAAEQEQLSKAAK
jgi:hypothetical protein